MDTQTAFDFERTHARRSDPETSKAAARSMLEGARAHREAIYWALLRAGIPLNYCEIAKRSGLEPVQVNRRLKEMADPGKDGRVEPTGETRATRTGRPAQLYRLRATGEAMKTGRVG